MRIELTEEQQEALLFALRASYVHQDEKDFLIAAITRAAKPVPHEKTVIDCPVCGSQPIVTWLREELTHVACGHLSIFGPTANTAIEAWNAAARKAKK